MKMDANIFFLVLSYKLREAGVRESALLISDMTENSFFVDQMLQFIDVG